MRGLVLLVLGLGMLIAAHADPERVIIYLDINGTILAEDLAGGRSVDTFLLYAMANYYSYCWDERIAEPICYMRYIEDYLLPGKKSDRALKKKRVALVAEFLQYLKKEHHPLYQEAYSMYRAMHEKLASMDGVIFPGVFTLFDYLNTQDIEYTVILRSFGHDILRIKDEINRLLGYEFFTADAQFKQDVLFINQGSKQVQISDPRHIYQYIIKQSHMTIQDDYFHWNGHEEHEEYGKPFVVDLDDKETVSIFFDDHIVTTKGEKMNIVHSFDAKTGKPLDRWELIERGNLVPVNTINALMDDNFFIDHVKRLIEVER